MTRGVVAIVGLAAAGAAAILSAQSAPAGSDPVLGRILAEGMNRSQVAPLFRVLTNDIGPRLTASPAQKRASDWARDPISSRRPS